MNAADPFASFVELVLDEGHEALAHRSLAWSVECSQRPDLREHVNRAFLASTFGRLCAPRSANPAEILLSVKFLVLFWQIDEATSDQIESFIEYLNQGTASDERAVAEFKCYHSSLTTELRKMHATSGFDGAVRQLCLTVKQEKTSHKQDWSEAEMLAVRKIICGIPAFSECWRAIRGIEFGPEVEAELSRHPVLDITCELASLVNDIASFDRDAAEMQVSLESADANLVLLRMRTLGNREAALESAIHWYNSKVEEFHRAEQALLHGELGSDPALRGYLEILHCAIVGDLATSKHLVPLRYEGSAVALERLVKLDELR